MKERDFVERILNRLLQIEKMRFRSLNTELRQLPGGRLIIRKRGRKYFMYRLKDGKEQGMTGKAIAQQLARKCFIENQMYICRENCRILERAAEEMERAREIVESGKKKSLGGATYRRLGEVMDETVYGFSAGERKWMERNSGRNPFKREDLRYMTRQGVAVRSKSERMIADLLNGYGLVYRYEGKLVVEDGVFYPDFIIIAKDGRKVIWEHMGLMDNDDYRSRANVKINAYLKAGFRQHTDLICTVESDMDDEELLKGIIERYLL